MKFTSSFIILFLPWLILSGKYDASYIGMGVLCAAMVAWWCKDLLFPNEHLSIGNCIRQGIRFIPYACWLFWQIVLSNIHVLKVSLSPRMHDLISPKMVRFNTDVNEEISKFVLANSITLTPGTLSIDVEDGEIEVHSLAEELVAAFDDGEMDRRVTKLEGGR